MNAETYFTLKAAIIARGYESDVTWAENIKECDNPQSFAMEHCYVVCNSGMKAQVALNIFRRCWEALLYARPIDDSVFRNKPKRAAMQIVYDSRKEFFDGWLGAEDRLSYLETLPHIGPIIKFHLAKNLGMNICKPDRHLVRIASLFDMTPESLCAKVSAETGNAISVVDLIIWRAANLGLI